MNPRTAHVRLFLVPALVALVGALFVHDASAKPKEPKKGAAPEAAAADKGDKPYGEWKKVTKDTEVMRGFLTLYKKRENLYLEIPQDQFNKPILGIFSLARGIGSHFLLGGLPLNDHVLQFERNGDYVMVLEENMRFVAPKGSPFESARELSHGN